MEREWLKKHLNIVQTDEEVIIWGNGAVTNVNIFISLFGNVIKEALENKDDVKKAISKNDNGRGFSSLILS